MLCKQARRNACVQSVTSSNTPFQSTPHTRINYKIPIIPKLLRIHHAAIICSDDERSKFFYTEILGLKMLAENFRATREYWKLDLALLDGGQIELFSFKGAPPRPSYPEAQGLRHLAFAVASVSEWALHLEAHGVAVEDIRTDEYTEQRFVFFADPNGLPLELYEAKAQSTSPST